MAVSVCVYFFCFIENNGNFDPSISAACLLAGTVGERGRGVRGRSAWPRGAAPYARTRAAAPPRATRTPCTGAARSKNTWYTLLINL